MSAGHIVNGQCVDVAASADIFFSHTVPQSFQMPNQVGGIDVFQLVPAKDAGVWVWQQYMNSQYMGSVTATLPGYAACDTTDALFDGMAMGWLVVAAMAVAWGVMIVRRAAT